MLNYNISIFDWFRGSLDMYMCNEKIFGLLGGCLGVLTFINILRVIFKGILKFNNDESKEKFNSDKLFNHWSSSSGGDGDDEWIKKLKKIVDKVKNKKKKTKKKPKMMFEKEKKIVIFIDRVVVCAGVAVVIYYIVEFIFGSGPGSQ